LECTNANIDNTIRVYVSDISNSSASRAKLGKSQEMLVIVPIISKFIVMMIRHKIFLAYLPK